MKKPFYSSFSYLRLNCFVYKHETFWFCFASSETIVLSQCETVCDIDKKIKKECLTLFFLSCSCLFLHVIEYNWKE